jgi:hypothetical protein
VVIGGSARRVGRFPVGRFCTVTAAFGGFDLDLRTAVPSQDEITLTVWSVAARVAITVPDRWRVTNQVLVLGSRQAMADRDGPPGEPAAAAPRDLRRRIFPPDAGLNPPSPPTLNPANHSHPSRHRHPVPRLSWLWQPVQRIVVVVTTTNASGREVAPDSAASTPR